MKLQLESLKDNSIFDSLSNLDRHGRLPPGGVSRMVFYVIGTENIWVSLPVDKAPEVFPHGAEVLITGKITRDSEYFLRQKLRPYFLADEILIIDQAVTLYPVIYQPE